MDMKVIEQQPIATEVLLEGRTGVMIGRQGGKSIEVPLTEVVANRHPEPNLRLLTLAQELSG